MKFSLSVLVRQCNSMIKLKRRSIPITEQVSTFRINNNRWVFRVKTEAGIYILWLGIIGATLLSTYSQYFVMCGHVYIEIKNLWPHSIKNVMISWICTALHRILIIKFKNEIQCRHIGKLKYAENTESHANTE
jgi:hypothetical protein